jgi:hypothetical protein
VSPVSGQSAEGRAYLALRKRAAAEGRNSDELHQLYALEGFLCRLVASNASNKFVLKGGVLLAALNSRRPTRDIDLAGLDLSNDNETVLGLIRAVLEQQPPKEDGLTFDADGATARTIRDEDEYSGVRVTIRATLATAKIAFHVDVSVGDPIWPAPTLVQLPRLLDDETLTIQGYPLHMVHAEKIATALQRGTVNTRWRDFADVWTLISRHSVNGADLRAALIAVTTHRRIDMTPLKEALDGFADLAQQNWIAWRRRQGHSHIPTDFAEVLALICDFADPALSRNIDEQVWSAQHLKWHTP